MLLPRMLIRVLFIIPVLARARGDELLLKRCLESIKRHDPLMLAHTLIVEELASIGVRWCENYGCKYVQKTVEPSYSKSVNIGLEIARKHSYTHVVTINQDVELLAPILVPFIRAFKKADIAGGLLLYPSGKVQSAGWYYREPDCMPVEHEKGQYFDEQSQGLLCNKERFVGGVTGALQGFSLELGSYDEDFGLSYEDVEFCIRALESGKKIFYTPTIRAVHCESATRGYFVGPVELRSYEKYFQIVKDKSAGALNEIVRLYNTEI